MADTGLENSTPLDRLIFSIFEDNEEMVLKYFSYLLIFVYTIIFVLLITAGKARYGRYRDKSGKFVSLRNNYVWMLECMPSFLLPLVLAFFTEAKQLSNPANMVCLVLYAAHYFHRTFIYSACIRGGTPVPWEIFIFSIIHHTLWSYLQGRYLTKYLVLSKEWIQDPRFVIGCALFLLGMAINIHSDHLLIRLRKPEETGYKIPTGGLFNYVTGANYFGECVEWMGYALALWSLPGFTMAFITLCNIGPRAFHHHEYYHRKFENYPPNRKALIPFVI